MRASDQITMIESKATRREASRVLGLLAGGRFLGFGSQDIARCNADLMSQLGIICGKLIVPPRFSWWNHQGGSGLARLCSVQDTVKSRAASAPPSFLGSISQSLTRGASLSSSFILA